MSTSLPPKKIWIIRYCDSYFCMIGPDGELYEKESRPKKLAKIAWEKGADEVRHNYDLRLDPDL